MSILTWEGMMGNVLDKIMLKIKKALFKFSADDVIDSSIEKRELINSTRKLLKTRRSQLKRCKNENAPQFLIDRIAQEISDLEKKENELLSK